MRTENLRHRMAAGERLTGTFLKIPEITVIEVLAETGLDFLCIDGEHGSWDRGRTDACLAIARALDVPMLVRVGAGTEVEILRALDAGAVGVVVPHVSTPEKARAVVAAAHFGRGGRGYAGTTRWAGFGANKMPDVLARDAQTIVIAQIEEPEGVDAVEDIAAVDGIDGVFAGPSDLSISYGLNKVGSPELFAALEKIAAAAKANDKCFVSWAADAATAKDWAARFGVQMFFVGADHGFIAAGARALAAEMKS
ncbi:MAG: aldolase [Rhodobacteraceae bacterium]|nr:aldolase [Paracoccaceae bacterium]